MTSLCSPESEASLGKTQHLELTQMLASSVNHMAAI